jgi:hypothetical protein
MPYFAKFKTNYISLSGMRLMNKVTFYVILLHSLLLGMATATAETLPSNLTHKGQKANLSLLSQTTKQNKEVSTVNTEPAWKKLPTPQVWVINQQQKPERQPFAWVVENTKKAQQQPFLEVGKSAKKPTTKPNTTEKPSSKDDLEPFDEVVKDTEKKEGLFTLYHNKKKNKVYLEIKPEQLNDNYLATATLESGIGERGIYSGMPLQDFLFYWQRVDDKLHFIVRNVNFRTREGDPQARSLARSFSDSTLYMLSIKSIHPQRKTILVDLGDLLLADLAGLSGSLNLTASSDQSYFGNAKAFPQNVEIESVLNFSSSGGSRENEISNSATLADSRGYTLRVHYSFSQLPNNNYRPRLADERIGYFITAYQDLTKDNGDPFVRYINRWHLEKQDPKAAISRPKKPIVFWIDNAVPLEYRDAVKEGILMWNKAFLKAGFKDAIEARQMPDDATWDPADIRYNTIRWINTVDGYFAMGPSRVNPLTGEILDADILVDASFVRAIKSEYNKVIQPSLTQNQNRTSLSAWIQNRFLCSSGLATQDKNPQQSEPSGLLRNLSKLAGQYDLCYGMEAANQFAFGSLAMTLLPNNKSTQEQLKEYTHQYLRLIIAHEVGHTLGLRHNFRGSTLLSPQEMNNKDITQNKGLTTSVMDYIPPNIAPHGTKQGDYFPNAVGVYDDWAIQYGYQPSQATTPIAERAFLQEIANQSFKPEYSYSTDEDVYDLDPTADAWDNSNNVLVYSQWQLDNSRVMWDRLNKGYPIAGESYSDVSERFSTVLGNYFRQVYYISKYIGGQSFYRMKAADVPSSNLSDGQNKLPFEPVPVEEQRQALKTLQKYVFAEDALKFSPELLNKLAPSRWRHWGSRPRVGRLDYPIHELVLFLQSAVLRDLLSADRLYRLKDLELKSQKEQALTLPELFDTLQSGIWTEVIKPQGSGLQISSLRRGLQREYLDILIGMVLRKQYVPEDARTLAWYKLKQLDEKLGQVNSNDEYSKAHILETRDRIEKVLNAQVQGN